MGVEASLDPVVGPTPPGTPSVTTSLAQMGKNGDEHPPHGAGHPPLPHVPEQAEHPQPQLRHPPTQPGSQHRPLPARPRSPGARAGLGCVRLCAGCAAQGSGARTGPGARFREQERIRQWINTNVLLPAAGMRSVRPPPCGLAGSPGPPDTSNGLDIVLVLPWVSSPPWAPSPSHYLPGPALGAINVLLWMPSPSHHGYCPHAITHPI